VCVSLKVSSHGHKWRAVIGMPAQTCKAHTNTRPLTHTCWHTCQAL